VIYTESLNYCTAQCGLHGKLKQVADVL